MRSVIPQAARVGIQACHEVGKLALGLKPRNLRFLGVPLEEPDSYITAGLHATGMLNKSTNTQLCHALPWADANAAQPRTCKPHTTKTHKRRVGHTHKSRSPQDPRPRQTPALNLTAATSCPAASR